MSAEIHELKTSSKCDKKTIGYVAVPLQIPPGWERTNRWRTRELPEYLEIYETADAARAAQGDRGEGFNYVITRIVAGAESLA